MKTYKILLIIVAFFLLAKTASLLASYYVSITTPSIIEETEQKAKYSKLILSKIGGYRGFETHYNENDFKDSVASFSIKIVGVDKSAFFKFKVRKDMHGEWVVIKSDTLYVN